LNGRNHDNSSFDGDEGANSMLKNNDELFYDANEDGQDQDDDDADDDDDDLIDEDMIDEEAQL